MSLNSAVLEPAKVSRTPRTRRTPAFKPMNFGTRTKLICADLFAGAGGATTAIMLAAKRLGFDVELTAVNHWQTAVDTHSMNYPSFVHYCQAVGKVSPAEAIRGLYLDILVCGPECTGHSNAAGGMPRSNQSRCSAMDVIHWICDIDVRNIIVENVREWMSWGPMRQKIDEDGNLMFCKDGTPWMEPIPERKGEYFRAFLDLLRQLGYQMEYRILCAADYGDVTTRKRLFLLAWKGGEAPIWPTPTHRPRKDVARFPGSQSWKPVRDIIDFSLPSGSIYSRRKELEEATMRRIYTGFVKYAGLPFIVANRTNNVPTSLNQPIPTQCTSNNLFLVEPALHSYLVNMKGKSTAADIDLPAPTQTTRPHLYVADPYLIGAGGPVGCGRPQQISDPLGTILKENHRGLAEPLIVDVNVFPPQGVKSPFLYYGYTGKTGKDLDEPIPALTAQWNHFGLVSPQVKDLSLGCVGGVGLQPILVRYNGGDNRSQSLNDPLTTLDTSNRFALCQFIVQYNGKGENVFALTEPLRTVTTRDRFGLVQLEIVPGAPEGVYQASIVGWIDIRFRMLQPEELKLAHSFPKEYVFTGTKEDEVAQIGNSWPVETGARLCESLLTRKGGLGRTPGWRKAGQVFRLNFERCLAIMNEAEKLDWANLWDAAGEDLVLGLAAPKARANARRQRRSIASSATSQAASRATSRTTSSERISA